MAKKETTMFGEESKTIETAVKGKQGRKKGVANKVTRPRTTNTVKIVIPRNPVAAYQLGLTMAQYQ
jgi:hypothetical protein